MQTTRQTQNLIALNSKYRAKLIASCIFNLLIPLMVVASLVWASFLPGILLDEGKYSWGYYSTISNIIIFIVCIIFFVYEILLLKNKIKSIPEDIYTVKYISTSSIFITFITILLLAICLEFKPIKDFNKDLYFGPNILSCLITPILSLMTYLVFEHNTISLKLTPLCLLPIVTYSVLYFIIVFTHFDANTGVTIDGKLYDGYHFIETGSVIGAGPILIMFFGFCYLFSGLIWLINRKIHIGEKKSPRVLIKKASTCKS